MRGDADAVAAAAALLAQSERPVIIAGDAVMQSRAHQELAALAEALGAPVYCEFVPNTASFPSSHPLYRGSMTRSQPGVREVLDKHDLLFSVGGDLFTWSLPSNVNPWPAGLPLIHLDTDPWQIGKNYPAQVGIFGDPKATLPDITKALGERMTAAQKGAAAARLKSMTDVIKADRDAFRAKARALAGKTPVQPLALLEAIGSMLPKDAVVIEEVLSSAPGARSLINSDDPQSFFALRGGGIGWGLPAAIGVKLAVPDRPVVALVGDGSAMYTVQGLWTAAHYKLPIVWVIFNNTSYRILKQRLVNMRGLAEQSDNFVGMNLTDPAIDFVGLAKSLGIEGARAKTVKDATDLIAKALKDGTALLIDVDMDRNYKPM
jgi:benzoylformate decarboxylase